MYVDYNLDYGRLMMHRCVCVRPWMLIHERASVGLKIGHMPFLLIFAFKRIESEANRLLIKPHANQANERIYMGGDKCCVPCNTHPLVLLRLLSKHPQHTYDIKRCIV